MSAHFDRRAMALLVLAALGGSGGEPPGLELLPLKLAAAGREASGSVSRPFRPGQTASSE